MWQNIFVVCVLMASGFSAQGGVQTGGQTGGQTSAPDVQLAGVVPKNSSEQFELAFWESIKDSSHAGDFEAYLKAYPKGRFVPLAQARMARLRAAAEKAAPAANTTPATPAAPETKPAGKSANQPADQSAAAPAAQPVPQRAAHRAAKSERTAKVAGRSSKAAAKEAAARDSDESAAPIVEPVARREFKDCPECPRVVVLAPGVFTMGGSSIDQTEQPAHLVTLEHPFAIGKYEVTVREWNACVEAGGCKSTAQYAGLSPRAPIRDISWNDAQQYVQWLSKLTGASYRLPSEAEWEYAERGGTSTRYWWGDQMAPGKANCKDCGPPWQIDEPVEAGSFEPNPYGLYDMNGSVWEWVQDCWHNSFSQAPGDAVPWDDQPGCEARVVRGGSWRDSAPFMVASTRAGDAPSLRQSQNGFRVARDVD
jgi:formylglycine-generating enzyme required for sulfatase activity